MKRLRAQLTGFTAAVAALFALTIAVPRAGLYYHEHAGGEHAHVHADDGSALAEILADYWHGHDHDHGHDHSHEHLSGSAPAHPAPSSAALTRDDGSAAGHWHRQDRFQRAVVATTAGLVAIAPVAGALQQAPTPPAPMAALDLRARGPPPLPLS